MPIHTKRERKKGIRKRLRTVAPRIRKTKIGAGLFKATGFDNPFRRFLFFRGTPVGRTLRPFAKALGL